jgi:hypothetical protein
MFVHQLELNCLFTAGAEAFVVPHHPLSEETDFERTADHSMTMKELINLTE